MTDAAALSVYDFSAPLLGQTPDESAISLAEFRGQVLLIVNTASKCGFTPQYAALEQLYRTYMEHGFVVLAFPCNQFGAQEPGSDAQIASFCERNFGISFPVFSKIDVNGPLTHPLYKFLKSSQPGIFGSERIKWNFSKFLVDRTGRVVSRSAPATNPKRLAANIERLLSVPPLRS